MTTSDSNLSKTKPAFRTKGAVTGNFGAGRRKAGSILNDVPVNQRDSLGSFPTQDEYADRLREAIRLGASGTVLEFIQTELKRIERRSGHDDHGMPNPSGPFCYIQDHFVTKAQ